MTVVTKTESSVCISCQLKDAGKRRKAHRRSNTLRGFQKETGLYLDGSLENPVKGAEGVSR